MRIKLIDFGLAADFTDLSETSLLHDKSGTSGYMAPELIGLNYLKKLYDEKVDVYSLGIIIYESLSGFNPFSNIDY